MQLTICESLGKADHTGSLGMILIASTESSVKHGSACLVTITVLYVVPGGQKTQRRRTIQLYVNVKVNVQHQKWGFHCPEGEPEIWPRSLFLGLICKGLLQP